MHDAQLLDEMAPVAAQLYERHLSTTREWFPHDNQPWHLGAELDLDRPWSEDDTHLSPEVRSSLLVNVLTEDNLPYYFRDIERMFSVDEGWAEWTRRWTAEEGRHSIAIRDYLVLTKAVCPIELERARMAQVSCGETPRPPRATNGFVYLALQELATRIAHHNTGKMLDCPAGYEIMKRVAADENFHFLFYRDAAKAAIEIAPSDMVIAMEAEVRNFEMPGTGIKDFSQHARRIAQAGIYDFVIHLDQIIVPVVLRHWGLEDITGLDDEAERARDDLMAFIDRLGRIADRQRARQLEPAGA